MNNNNDMLPSEMIEEDRRTDFLKQQSKVKAGHKMNACRNRGFGCQDHELDPGTGYCRHLVGFLVEGDFTRFVPRKKKLTASKGDLGGWYMDADDVQSVLPTDKTVIVSDGLCGRVYRNVDVVAPVDPVEPPVEPDGQDESSDPPEGSKMKKNRKPQLAAFN